MKMARVRPSGTRRTSRFGICAPDQWAVDDTDGRGFFLGVLFTPAILAPPPRMAKANLRQQTSGS
jgi:hypothetical protein